MKYEIGSFSLDGERVGGQEDGARWRAEGWRNSVCWQCCFGKSLLWLERLPAAVTFIATCVYCSFGSDETIRFVPSKHINTQNGLFMRVLILYEVPEQIVWAKILGYKPSERERRENSRHFLFQYGFACVCVLSGTGFLWACVKQGTGLIPPQIIWMANTFK